MKTQVTMRPTDEFLVENAATFLSVSEQSLLGSMTQIRRSDWLAGRYILKSLFQEVSSNEILLSEIEVLYENKRPILIYAGKSWKASISHSQEYVAVSFACGSQPGIDIEQLKPRNAYLQKYMLSKEELQILQGDVHATTIAWTLKEAAFKADLFQVTMPEYKITKRLAAGKYSVCNIQTEVEFEVTTAFIANYVFSYTLYSL